MLRRAGFGAASLQDWMLKMTLQVEGAGFGAISSENAISPLSIQKTEDKKHTE
jgi:hypothetical protein